MTDGSRELSKLMKWLLLLSFFLLSDSAQTGSHIETSEADRTLDADETLNDPPSQSQLNGNLAKKPSLQPNPSRPPIGNYYLTNPNGQVCMKANMGVQYMLTIDKKFYYFNIDPRGTRPTGYCGNRTAVLSLEFEGGNVEFNFVKDGKEYYTRRMRAQLEPELKCKKCKNKVYRYSGVVEEEKQFKTTTGLSFKCKSDLVVKMSSELRLKVMASQFQPFDLAKGQFGKDFECWPDYIKRVIPIILGAIAVGVFLIALVSYLVIREYRNRDYERLS
ncbi:lysosome-associated membrane glycoprotein 3 [Engraulis encrasicolus]|uniref:lysosome-associated membrane glycoprotein 3 n=1 Tax=Engraulis encrasicolus TaxID=184585 RepID=UPI002FD0B0BC